VKPYPIAHYKNITSLGGTQMWEKNKRCLTCLLILDNRKPKSGPLFDSMKDIKNSNIHSEPVKSPRKSIRLMQWQDLYRIALLKNSGTISEKAGNHGSHLQEEVQMEMQPSLRCGRITLQHNWTQSKNCEIGNFVTQNINSQESFWRVWWPDGQHL